MRIRVLVPIVVLLLLFCGALGTTVYFNISASANDLINRQLEERLNILADKILQARQTSGTLSSPQIETLVDSLKVNDGGVFVVNANGIIVADSPRFETGHDVSSQSWYQNALQASSISFTTTYGQAPVTARSIIFEDKILVSYLPTESVEALTVTPLYVIGVVGLVGVIIMTLLCYLIVTRLLINPLESLSEQIGDYVEGEPLKTKPLLRCPELASIGRQLNQLLKEPPNILQSDTQSLLAQPLAARPLATPSQKVRPLVTQPQKAKKAAHVAEAVALQTGEPVSFEFAELLREVFEPYRPTVIARKYQFSLRVGKGVPQIIIANKLLFATEIDNLFVRAFSEAAVGDKISAEVDLLFSPREDNFQDVSISFSIYYNGSEQTTILEARKG